jgi:hypothetical protein
MGIRQFRSPNSSEVWVIGVTKVVGDYYSGMAVSPINAGNNAVMSQTCRGQSCDMVPDSNLAQKN